MQKHFISGIFISLALNFLIKPFSVLVIDAGIQRSLGNEVYGKYFALLSLTLIANILLDLGINNYTVRNIAQDEKRISYHLNNIIYLRGILFLVYAGFVLFLAFIFDLIKTNETVLFLLIFNQFLVQSIALIRSVFSGQHRFFLDSFLSVLDRALLILFIGLAFIQFPYWISIELFVIVQTACYLITLLVGLFHLRGLVEWSALALNWKYIREIVTHSAPYATLVLFMLIYNRADTLLIRLLAPDGAYEAGVFAQGFRLYDALYMVGIIFASVLFPMFSRMLHQRDQQINELISVSFRWLVGGALALVFVAVENAELILSSLYQDHVTQHSSFIFIGLMLAFLAMSFNFIFGTLLTANGSLKILNSISILAAVFSVSLNACMIPWYGSKGAVVVAIITQATVSSLLIYYSIIKVQLRITPAYWLPLIFFIGFLSCIHFLLSGFSNYSVLFLSVSSVIFGIFWFSVVEVKNIYLFSLNKTDTQ
ncbi:MAG: oligosaccharide flippase family protein [Bacteroidetes bacterium]|nr:oligosaccharide flippase family protein [Bacteroidota bacterium]